MLIFHRSSTVPYSTCTVLRGSLVGYELSTMTAEYGDPTGLTRYLTSMSRPCVSGTTSCASASTAVTHMSSIAGPVLAQVRGFLSRAGMRYGGACATCSQVAATNSFISVEEFERSGTTLSTWLNTSSAVVSMLKRSRWWTFAAIWSPPASRTSASSVSGFGTVRLSLSTLEDSVGSDGWTRSYSM
jgi:hypothetical protein